MKLICGPQKFLRVLSTVTSLPEGLSLRSHFVCSDSLLTYQNSSPTTPVFKR